MDITLDELAQFLNRLDPLIGDRRTKQTVQGVISGIITGETLRCTRIAAFSPYLSRAACGL